MATEKITSVREMVEEMMVRSVGNDWTGARWEELYHDEGIRYEIIDGVLYMNAPPWRGMIVDPTRTHDAEPVTVRSLEGGWTAVMWEQLNHGEGIRYEIIEGVLYMSASPSLFHQRILGLLYIALYQQLDATGKAFVFFAPTGIFMPDTDPVQPDLIVVGRGGIDIGREKRFHGIPAMLVEILSPSNSAYDLGTKRTRYARAGVPEYWVVRPQERDLIVYSDPDTTTGKYCTVAHIAPDGELVSPTLPFRAPLAAFFADAPDDTP